MAHAGSRVALIKNSGIWKYVHRNILGSLVSFWIEVMRMKMSLALWAEGLRRTYII